VVGSKSLNSSVGRATDL